MQIIKQILNYNRAYDMEDYIQEAQLALIEAERRYEEIENGKKRVNMRFENYSHYFVRKHLYKMADTKEIAFEIYDETGNYVKTLFNGDFRRQKKELIKNGYTYRSIYLTKSLTATNDDDEEYELLIPDYVNYEELVQL